MKHLAVFMLAASCSFAGDFVTGQAARAVIGQSTFTIETPTPSEKVVGGVGGLAFANGSLFVVDSNQVGAFPVNNRVLIFDNMAQQLPGVAAVVPQGPPENPIRCPLCTGTAEVVLGQENFTDSKLAITRTGMSQPTGIATDGTRVAVADTNNNRVLIWNSIPSGQGQPADLVIGQPDFTSNCLNATGPGLVGSPTPCPGDARVPNQKGLKGPSGVWIQDGKLFVADTLNHRVLIWNNFPTQSFQQADVVLGQPNFYTTTEQDMTKPESLNPRANTLLSPVAVSSDGQRLFVSDLGHNRVLIWNQIPNQQQAPADVVIGQPNMTTAIANYTGTGGVCAATGKDADGNDTWPALCAATISWPRFALSDGTRLFVADGGNDRVLVFNSIPTQNGASANTVLGQRDATVVETSDDTYSPHLGRRGSADSLRTPLSLAWDGTNLYVADPFNRRIMVFSAGDTPLGLTAIRNSASMDVFALGSITFNGTIAENDEVTVNVHDKAYKYKATKDDTLGTIATNLAGVINANEGDPLVLASAEPVINTILLTARAGGPDGNNIDYSVAVSPATSKLLATATGSTLAGGQNAAKIGEGSLVSIFGTNLADGEAYAPAGADPLPTNIGGVRVYFDGLESPLLAVTPGQINAQMPFELLDSTTTSAYVRTEHSNGSVTVTNPVAVSVVGANPGIFAMPGADPRPAIAVHSSSSATGMVLIDGSDPAAGDTATVVVDGVDYTYTAKAGDTLKTMRDNLVQLVNDNCPKARAEAAGGEYSRVILHARVEGPDGNGLSFGSKATGNPTLTTLMDKLCCANIAGALVTEQNPAQAGEIISVYATGMGMVKPDDAKYAVWTGWTFKGPLQHTTEQVVSAAAGTLTSNVLYSGMVQGSVGLYRVDIALHPELVTNPRTQMTISQNLFISNVVTIPVVAQPQPEE